MSAVLLGSHFWTRQKQWREKRFGLSTIHEVLNGSYTDPKAYQPMDARTLEIEKRAEVRKWHSRFAIHI